MKTLRIFISSTGDVAAERERAREVVAGPVGVENDILRPGIFDVASGKLLQVLDVEMGNYGRGAHPYFGFSPDGTRVFFSTLDAASPDNSIWSATLRSGTFVGDTETTATRFLAWSPDGKWRYEVSNEGETLHIHSVDGRSSYGIPNAVHGGAYPVFADLPFQAEATAEGRHALGGFVFSRTQPEPILRIPPELVDLSSEGATFLGQEAARPTTTGSRPAVRDTAAVLLQKWWIRLADESTQATPSSSAALHRPSREHPDAAPLPEMGRASVLSPGEGGDDEDTGRAPQPGR